MEMKIIFFFLLSSFLYAAQVPSLPECSPKTQADNSVTLDCILAEISLHETAKEGQNTWLGVGSYVALMRFHVKNPQMFSKIVIYKSVVGAVEECSIRNLFNFSSALLVMQSPSPLPGGMYLRGVFGECLKSILSEELLNALFDDMTFLVNKKSFSRRTQIN